MSALQQQEPSEVIVKLVLPFLHWTEVIDSGELVCKRWRVAAKSDDVWRPICNNEIAYFWDVWNMWQKSGQVYDSSKYELLKSQLGKQGITGKSCRDIFVLSRRIGKLIDTHREYGPDGTKKGRENWSNDSIRTLRQIICHDYPLIVRPAIENLRRVFCRKGDDNNHENEHDLRIADTKIKLSIHAQNHDILRRKKAYSLRKKQIFEMAGQYMLAAGTMSSASICYNAFISPMPIELSLGEMVKVIENALGGKISLSTSVELKSKPSGGIEKVFTYQPPMKKLRSMNCLNDLEWPLNPKDVTCFLLEELWFSKNEYFDECDKLYEPGMSRHVLKQKEAALIDSKMKEWWGGLTGPIRQLLLHLYEDQVGCLPNLDPLPEGFDKGGNSDHIPIKVLRHICDPPENKSLRGRLALFFWNNLKPELRDGIFKLYEQKCSHFIEMIRQDYISIYEGANLEITAQTLLDIFLQIPPEEKYTRAPKMTTDYCQALLGRMEEAMNRWDQLIDSVQEDDEQLWNPQSITEIKSISSKFDVDLIWHRGGFSQNNEFCINYMTKRYLCQLLSTKDEVPRYYDMKKKIEKVHTEMKKLEDENGTVSYDKFFTHMNLAEVQEAIHEFQTYRKFILTREHAMIALIPLLPSLSQFDSKRLVYAIFIQRDRFMAKPGNTFSRNENFDEFYKGKLPLPNKCSKFHQPILDMWSSIAANASNWIDSDSASLQTSRLELWPKVLDAQSWMNSNTSFSKRQDVASRLFGLPLPKNIVQAMCQFMLENLYQTEGSLNDVSYNKNRNAFKVLKYMERFAHGNADDAALIWNTLNTALQNATTAVQGIDADAIEPEMRTAYQRTVEKLIGACMGTRAERVIPTIEILFGDAPPGLLSEHMLPLETLIQRIREAPKIAVDTGSFHSIS